MPAREYINGNGRANGHCRKGREFRVRLRPQTDEESVDDEQRKGPATFFELLRAIVFGGFLPLLKLVETRVWIVLMCCHNTMTGTVWISIAKIAILVGAAQSRVCQALRELERLGFVETTERGGGRRSTHRRLRIPPSARKNVVGLDLARPDLARPNLNRAPRYDLNRAARYDLNRAARLKLNPGTPNQNSKGNNKPTSKGIGGSLSHFGFGDQSDSATRLVEEYRVARGAVEKAVRKMGDGFADDLIDVLVDKESNDPTVKSINKLAAFFCRYPKRLRPLNGSRRSESGLSADELKDLFFGDASTGSHTGVEDDGDDEMDEDVISDEVPADMQ